MIPRFTIDGSEDLEAQIAELCLEAGEGIRRIVPPRRIEAMLLGGGYGRGEGGVLYADGKEQPYNDLEFYVLVQGSEMWNQRRYGRKIHMWSEEISRRAGLEVEFKLLSRQRLERSGVTMFYYDLISAHRLISGSESVLSECGHHRASHQIPLFEATRLLMNRCSGLLYARARLQREDFGPGDADFVGRNLAKAKLALGDAVLTLQGQYHFSCLERHRRLKKLRPDPSITGSSSLIPLHEQGVEFKLRPSRDTRSPAEFEAEFGFLKELAREIWLTAESRRLGGRFGSAREYAMDPQNKCPETRPCKNRLINVRQDGIRGLFDDRYPRERLLRSLPVLLWEPEACQESGTRGLLERCLRTDADDWRSFIQPYEALWRIYN